MSSKFHHCIQIFIIYKLFSLHVLQWSASWNETHISYKAEKKLQNNYCIVTTRHLLNKRNQPLWQRSSCCHCSMEGAEVTWKKKYRVGKKSPAKHPTPKFVLCLVPVHWPLNPPHQPTWTVPTPLPTHTHIPCSNPGEGKAPGVVCLEHPRLALAWGCLLHPVIFRIALLL